MTDASPDLLFSYGTLRDPAVQRAVFGRLVAGEPDALVGYTLQMVAITDAHVLEVSGLAEHPVAVETEDPTQLVDGVALAVTVADIAAADAYEVDDYVRVRVMLASGRPAWFYAAAGGSGDVTTAA